MRKKTKGGFAGELREITAKTQVNIFLNNWIEHNIKAVLRISAKQGKNQEIICFSPAKIDDLGRCGGTIDKLKALLYQDNVDVTEMKGYGEFTAEEMDNLYIRFAW